VPFAFHVALATKEGEENTTSAPTRIVVANSLQQDVLLNPKHPATQEDVFVVHCSPQAVFKVRPATRCSSTLSGESLILLPPHTTHTLYRTYISNSLRRLFSNRKTTSNGFWRHKCAIMGFRYRDTIACSFRPSRLGTLCRVGSTREKTGYGWSRWACEDMGPKGRKGDRRCNERSHSVDHRSRMGTYPYVGEIHYCRNQGH
jgi:hypothetical protein